MSDTKEKSGSLETYETYDTNDFLTANFLLAKHARLVGSRFEGRWLVFIFANKAECENLINDLNYGDDNVSASVFFDAGKRLKKIIHSQDRGYGKR